MSALLSLLGGGAFRALMGQALDWLNKRQDHRQEIDRMKLQEQIDAAQHARNLAAQKQQAELGYKTINVQADADVSRLEAQAWIAAQAAQKPTGIKWVDAWNGCIRPSFGTLVLFLVLLYCGHNSWVMDAWTMELAGVVVGYFFVDRSLTKRGK